MKATKRILKPRYRIEFGVAPLSQQGYVEFWRKEPTEWVLVGMLLDQWFPDTDGYFLKKKHNPNEGNV